MGRRTLGKCACEKATSYKPHRGCHKSMKQAIPMGSPLSLLRTFAHVVCTPTDASPQVSSSASLPNAGEKNHMSHRGCSKSIEDTKWCLFSPLRTHADVGIPTEALLCQHVKALLSQHVSLAATSGEKKAHTFLGGLDFGPSCRSLLQHRGDDCRSRAAVRIVDRGYRDHLIIAGFPVCIGGRSG